jgi:hypothetical protein
VCSLRIHVSHFGMHLILADMHPYLLCLHLHKSPCIQYWSIIEEKEKKGNKSALYYLLLLWQKWQWHFLPSLLSLLPAQYSSLLVTVKAPRTFSMNFTEHKQCSRVCSKNGLSTCGHCWVLGSKASRHFPHFLPPPSSSLVKNLSEAPLTVQWNYQERHRCSCNLTYWCYS